MEEEKINLNNEIYVHQLTFESSMARLAHTNELLMKANKRLHIQNLAQLIVILGMLIGFLIYESQFEWSSETITQTVEQDTSADGSNHFIGGDYNGEAGSENNNSKVVKTKSVGES